MAIGKLIWPPKILDTTVAGPTQVLDEQVKALARLDTGLDPGLSRERKGNLRNGRPTLRTELLVRLNGSVVEIATIEYPAAPGYPALVVTGDAPHWRYSNAYSPDELVDVLQHELSRDPRLSV